jgi:hypothetical protein
VNALDFSTRAQYEEAFKASLPQTCRALEQCAVPKTYHMHTFHEYWFTYNLPFEALDRFSLSLILPQVRSRGRAGGGIILSRRLHTKTARHLYRTALAAAAPFNVVHRSVLNLNRTTLITNTISLLFSAQFWYISLLQHYERRFLRYVVCPLYS